MTLARFFAFLNIVGLLGGVLGGLFLFYSFTLRASNFSLDKVRDKEVAICMDGRVVVAGFGGPLVVSDDACPDVKGAGLTPQVVSDRPTLAKWGVVLVILGFLLQIPAASVALK